jgi:molybdopterin converting factor small subunit
MRVLLFGPVRAQLGVDSVQIDVASTGELWTALVTQYPGLKPLLPTLRLARDGDFLAADAALDPADEIALIPPVSGG